jgi:hypothetical protein
MYVVNVQVKKTKNLEQGWLEFTWKEIRNRKPNP